MYMFKKYTQRTISGVGQSSTTAVDADSQTTNEIAESNSDSSPEESETSIVGVGRVGISSGSGAFDLGGEDNGHNNSVNGDDFAENNGDQVLGSDARSFDTGAENRGSCDEDTP